MNKKNNTMKFKIQRIRKELTTTQIYLGWLGGFAFIFLIIFISPSFTGGNYSYTEAELLEYEYLSNNLNLAVVKKEYDPENETIRLDFHINETSDQSELNNLKFDITSRYIKKPDPLNVVVHEVNKHYLVAIIEGVPQGFSVLSATIQPSFIHEEIARSTINEREVRMYFNEGEELEVAEINIKDIESFKHDYVVFEQEKLNKEIEKLEDEIRVNNLLINETKKEIAAFEEELLYMTEDDKLNHRNKINSRMNSIVNVESENEKLKEEINNINSRIELLDKRFSGK